MTDKASVEIPSPVAGKVLEVGGEVGQMLAVGSELIRIELESGAGAAASSAPASAAPVAPPPDVAPPAPARSASVQSKEEAPRPPPAVAMSPAVAQRPIASPALRARAWELGVDLRDVSATGTAGRIVQADLDAHVARGAP